MTLPCEIKYGPCNIQTLKWRAKNPWVVWKQYLNVTSGTCDLLASFKNGHADVENDPTKLAFEAPLLNNIKKVVYEIKTRALMQNFIFKNKLGKLMKELFVLILNIFFI